MADLSWMFEPVGGSGKAPGMDMDLLTLLGGMGRMGQGMLKGTDREWTAAPGAVAADIGTNLQAAGANKDQVSLLQQLVAALRNPYTAGVSGAVKPDGTFNLNAKSIEPKDQIAMDMVNSGKAGQNMFSETAGLSDGLSGRQSPFLQALYGQNRQ